MKIHKLILFFFFVLIVASCSNDKDKLNKFYETNKNNNGLFLFDAVHIKPARGIHTVKLFKYGGVVFKVSGFDKNDNYNKSQLIIEHGDDSFTKLKDDYNLGYEEAKQLLTRLFSVFNDLDVLAVYGMPDCKYIEFIVDQHTVIVYVPNKKLLDEEDIQHINSLEEKAIKKFDEQWFAFKLDKPFSFGS